MAKKFPPLRQRTPKSAGTGQAAPASIEDIKQSAVHATAAVDGLTAVPSAPVATLSPTRRLERARIIAARYRAASLVGGVTLIPALDIAVVTGLQLKMINALAKLYDVPFDKGRVRAILSSLVGGAVPQGAAVGATALIPGAGLAIGVGVGMVGSVLSTDAVAKLFINHFEAGGTLADFGIG